MIVTALWRHEVRLFGGDGGIVGALAAEPGMKQTSYVAQAFDMRGREGGAQFEGPHDTANIRAASGGSSRSYVAQSWAVRRLTPCECERLQGFAHDTFQSSFVDFGQQLRNGASAWDAFKNAGVNALGKIADKLMQMAADNLWKSAFGGASGSFLGGLGSLFGFGGGAGVGSVGVVGAAGSTVVPTFFHGGGVVGYGGYRRGAFPVSMFRDAPRFHDGSLGVGLRPDEIPAILQRGERVIPRGGNDNPTSNVINMPISVNASGNDPAQIAAAIRSYVNSSDFDARVVSSVTTAKKQRKLA